MKSPPNLVATLLVASALTACSKPETSEWNQGGPARYCVDAQNRRVPDDQCNTHPAGLNGGNPFLWYYLGSMMGRSNYVPPYGGFASGGGTIPVAGTRYGSVPRTFSGSRSSSGVTRGIFGGVGEGAGGGAGE